MPPLLAMFFGTDGPLEWLVIGLAVLLLFGSQRLPDTMRTLGRWSAKLYRARDEFRQEFQKALEVPRSEVGDQRSEIEPPVSDFRPPTSDLRPQTSDLRPPTSAPTPPTERAG